jgi:hypothetical protein
MDCGAIYTIKMEHRTKKRSLKMRRVYLLGFNDIEFEMVTNYW